jgi:hypothetical protein
VSACAVRARAGERLDLVELAGVEVMQAVVVVIIFGAGDELFESGRAIGREGKVLDEPDIAAGCGWGADDTPEPALPGRGP